MKVIVRQTQDNGLNLTALDFFASVKSLHKTET